MIFTQHHLSCLSHASYLIGDETTGRAVVVDPRRDVDGYLAEAAARVVHRTGDRDPPPRRLPRRPPRAGPQRARHLLRRRGRSRVPERAAARRGAPVARAKSTLEVLTTPGHTPESICIVVYEHADDQVPYGVLTGDTLFVGDVGRPDLSRPHPPHRRRARARRCTTRCTTSCSPSPTRRASSPAHGAGSSCGKQLSTETSSTIGSSAGPTTRSAHDRGRVRRRRSPGPTGPSSLLRVRRSRNRRLRPLLDGTAPSRCDHARRDARPAPRRRGAARRARADRTSPPATSRAPSTSGSRAGSPSGRATCSPERDIVLVGDPAYAQEAKVRLGRIGFDRVVGQLEDPRVARGPSRAARDQLPADGRQLAELDDGTET